MTVKLETLEFQIQSAGDVAAQGVDSLTQSLRRLRGASSGLSGINRLNTQLKSLNQTLTSFRGGTLDNLAKALNSLSTIRDIRIPNNLYRQIGAIGGALTILTDENINRLERLGQVLQTFRGLDDVRIPSMRTLQGGTGNHNSNSAIDSGITESLREMEEATERLPGVIGTITEVFEDMEHAIGLVTSAFNGYMFVMRIVMNVIKVATSIVRRFLAAINKLLTPVKKFAMLMGSAFVAPFKKIGETIKGAFGGIKQLWESLKRIAMYRLVRTAIATLTQAIKAGIDNLYQWSKLADGEFAKSMDNIATNALYVKNSLAAMVSPLINSVSPVLDMLSNKLVSLLNHINQTFSSLVGKDTYTAAKRIEAEFAKIKSHVIGIDELNIIEDTQPPVNEMFEEIPIDDDIKNFVDRLREIFEESDWEGLGTMLGEKINSWIDAVDWEAVGERIGYWLDAAAQTAYYTLDTIDFTVAGEKIGEMATNILESVNWEIVGRLLVKKITSVWDFAIGFLSELDWGAVAKSLFDFIVGALKEIGDWIDKYNWKELGNTLLEKIQDFFENFDFETAIQTFFTGLGKAVRAIKDLLTPLWDAFRDWWNEHIKGESFKETMKNLVDYIKTFADENILTPFIKGFLGEGEGEGEQKSGLQRLKEVGESIVTGIVKGAEDWVKENLWKWIADFFFGSWWDYLCDIFGIHSPAKTMIPIGQAIMMGIIEGLNKTFETLNSVIDGIKRAFEAITKEVWKVVVTVVDSATEVIKAIGTALANLISAGAQVIVTAIDAASGIIAAIGEALANIIAAGAQLVITAIDAASGVIQVVGEALAGIISAGANLVITAIDAATGVISAIGQGLAGLISAGANLVITAIDAATGVIAAIGQALAGIISVGANLVITAIDAATSVIEAIGQALVSIIGAYTQLVITAIDAASGVIEAIGQAAADLIRAGAQLIITAIDAASTVIAAIGQALADVIAAGARLVITAIDAASTVISAIGQAVADLISAGARLVVTAIDAASTVIAAIGQALADVIAAGARLVITAIDAASTVISAIGEAVADLIRAGAQLIITAIDAASTVITAIGQSLADLISAGTQLIITAIDAASTVITAIGQALADLIGAGTQLVITAIDAASTVISSIGDALADLIGAYAQLVITAIDAASGVISAVGSALSGLIGSVSTFVITAIDAASSVISSVGNALSDLVSANATFIITAIDAASSVISTIATSFNSLVGTATTVVNQISTAFSGAFSSIVSAAGNFTSSLITALGMQAVISQVSKLSEKLDSLNEEFSKIPSQLDIKIESNAASATSEIVSLNNELASIPRDITITIHIVLDGEIPSFNATGGIAHATGGIIPHAKGSIISRPTLTQYKGQTHLFGEAGREAILPLDSYTGWMDEVAEKVENRIEDDEDPNTNLYQMLRGWEPIINKIATDTQRTAEKDDRPVVKIGNRDIRTAYDTQVKMDGYSFTR